MKSIYRISLLCLAFISCAAQCADDDEWTISTGNRRRDKQRKREKQRRPTSPGTARLTMATVVSGRGSTRKTIVTPLTTQRANATEVSSGDTTHKPQRPCKPRAPMKPREPGYFASHKEKDRYRKKYAVYEQELTKYQEDITTYEVELAAFEEAEDAYHQVYPALAAATSTHI